MDHHEAAAADIAGARIAHRQRKTDRHRGVDCIAAFFENIDTDPRRAPLLRHHHAVVRDDSLGMADLILPQRRTRQRENGDQRQRGKQAYVSWTRLRYAARRTAPGKRD